METKAKFDEIKGILLKRAKEAKACVKEYLRAHGSENMEQLCAVIKDNFSWCCGNNVLTADIIESHREVFAEHEIYANMDTGKGFLLCDHSTVKAWGNATVVALSNATVEARDNAMVEARDNATVEAQDNVTVLAREKTKVEAWGNAKVEAQDRATVIAWSNATVIARDNTYCTSYLPIECKLSDNAIYRIRETNEIRFASEGIKFVKVDPEE